MVGGPKDNRWFGPLVRALRGAAFSPFVSQTFSPFLSEFRPEDPQLLRDLMESVELRAVIDGRFTLDEAPAAIEYLAQGRTRGKNIILVGDN